MEDLIRDANLLQLFPTSVPRLTTISQSVYNIMHSVEAVKIWKKYPLLQWYKEKMEGHQRHAFRNYLLTTFRDNTPRPESEPM